MQVFNLEMENLLSVFDDPDVLTLKQQYMNSLLKFKAINDEVRNYITISLINLAKRIKNEDVMVVIIRGLPGSGKSTLANQLHLILQITQKLSSVVCEADKFMGSKFDGSRLKMCHDLCKNLAQTTVVNGKIAIISNTNSTHREMHPYNQLGKSLVIEPLTPWKYDVDLCLKLCGKDIPKQTMSKYLENIKNGV